uniref:Uncharacterized protein n=1 Tax=Oryza glumipatula TaxID=40148 RepID=A0A0E0BL49_9ORYZ
MLKILREDGVDANSEQYHLAKELLRSRTRRTIFKRFDSKETRLKWLQWSWQNRKAIMASPSSSEDESEDDLLLAGAAACAAVALEMEGSNSERQRA